MSDHSSNPSPFFLAFRRLAGLFVLSQISCFIFLWRLKTQESQWVNKLRRKIKELVFQKVPMAGTSVASNRQRLSQRSCQEGKELTLAPHGFTRPSHVYPGQSFGGAHYPVNFRPFKSIFWSSLFHGHFDHRKVVLPVIS